MWFRRNSAPEDIRRALDVKPGERVLAAAALADGSWAVATTSELAVATEENESRPADVQLRRPWCDVDRASFDPERSVLIVEWVDAEPDLRLNLTDPARTAFPQVLRERVQWSVVLAEVISLPNGREAKVAVRRTTDGVLFSQAIAGPGVDLDDSAVTAVVDAAEARVRSAAGM
jgi:hypothetical protein